MFAQITNQSSNTLQLPKECWLYTSEKSLIFLVDLLMIIYICEILPEQLNSQ